MSSVADIILTTFIDDETASGSGVAMIAEYLTEAHNLKVAPLVKVDELAGGNKAMQCDVWVGAINSLDAAGLVRVFRSVPFKYPERAQLFIKEEYDDAFTVFPAVHPAKQGAPR